MNDDDARIRQLLIESLDAELGSRLDIPDPQRHRSASATRRHHQRWATPLAATAAVAVIAVGVVAVVGVRQHGSTPSAGDVTSRGVRVTCESPVGDATPDRAAITARAQALTKHAVTVDITGRSIRATVPGATPSEVSRLCSSHSVALRPLVAPVVVDRSGTRSEPLAGLGFAVPATDRAYEQLTTAQRSALTDALGNARCAAGHDAVAGTTVACDSGLMSGQPVAALLGRPIVTGSGIKDARAHAPNHASGSVQWTVTVTFTKGASRQWATFTGQHNTSKLSSVNPNARACSSTATPCSDFIGIVIDEQLISLPVTESQIDAGVTQFTGMFTRATASTLAADLRTGVLPIQLSVVAVTPTS